MNVKASPWLRLFIVLLLLVALFYLPAREFFKITFMLGIPFIFLLGFMHKRKKYSFPWVAALILLLATVAAYGSLLIQLPERIAARSIISEGAGLVAEGKFDEAIAEYKKLEEIDMTDKMNDKIMEAETEKKAAQLLSQAKQLLAQGEIEQARDSLDAIPDGTRAAREANKLRKSMES